MGDMEELDNGVNSIMMSFSEKLRTSRLNQRKTQKEVAADAGITGATLSAYEKGDKTPSLDIAVRIAEALQVSLEWMCGVYDRPSDEIVDYEGLIYFIDMVVRSKAGFVISYDSEHAVLATRDKQVIKIFTGWSNLLKLYRDGTIDEEIYGAWVEKQMKNYEGISITTKKKPSTGLSIDNDDMI